MGRKKVIRNILIICITLIIAGVIYVELIPHVELESSDERWRGIVFAQSAFPEELGWEGMIVYEGDGTVHDISTKLIYNGSTMCDSENTLIPFPGTFSLRTKLAIGVYDLEEPVFDTLVDFAEKPQNVQIDVKWVENGESCEARLEYTDN